MSVTTDPQAAPKTPLTKELLFKSRPLRTLDADIPDYGTTKTGELMGWQRDELDAKAVQRLDDGKGGTKVHQDYRNYRARACVYALLNPDSTKMFPDATEKDVLLVSQLPVRVIDAIFDAVDTLNALTKKRQEEVGKTSSETTGADSSSK